MSPLEYQIALWTTLWGNRTSSPITPPNTSPAPPLPSLLLPLHTPLSIENFTMHGSTMDAETLVWPWTENTSPLSIHRDNNELHKQIASSVNSVLVQDGHFMHTLKMLQIMP